MSLAAIYFGLWLALPLVLFIYGVYLRMTPERFAEGFSKRVKNAP